MAALIRHFRATVRCVNCGAKISGGAYCSRCGWFPGTRTARVSSAPEPS